MDRQTEKNRRITEELVPYVLRLKQESKNQWEYVKYDAQRYAARTWMLSTPVARDYASLAVALAKNGSTGEKLNPQPQTSV
jgi:hypothetical protein